ncbi:FadR family transcriptional regulator [Streptomyces bathyalis]|uniref:FadR family transcriptional regulator n=1 Tax=Streptomyces bathyalis TaxID=2710756 RepID=A0A7T1TAP2_9ACTN|nr:FadR/GntR family transcriptional regulator [Streptomyces bathyalis]QPP09498.1 FadR family transcriptional regulator [Streptomyces bathyalis]
MTDDALRPMTRPRLYEQVLDRLRAYAVDHELSAGDRLPPERELAQRLGVSRSSVKQAVVVLEVQGLVETRHGGGTYLVRDTLDAEPVERLVERRRRLPDVLEAREALETKLAELAAERRTDEDLEAMRTALRAMESDISTGGHGVDGDRRFHAAVTAAGHSTLLAEFMGSISEPVAESRNESLRQPGRPTRSLEQHARILAAIERGDPKAAAAAMRRHVRTVAKVRLLEWNPDEAGKGEPDRD